MSSSAPMQTAETHCCGPTTCSSAARNSRARLPWVTSTMPIIRPLCPDRCSSRPGPLGRRYRGGERVTERPALAQPVRQPFGDGHRAVAAAGAADGNGQIALALCVKTRQQRPDQALQPVDERPVVGIARDEGGDRRIAAGQRLQRRARSAGSSGSARRTPGRPRAAGRGGRRTTSPKCAVPAAPSEREMAEQQLLELVRRQRRGVDHEVGRIAQPADHACAPRRCRRPPAGRAPADGAAAIRCSGAAGSRCRNRGTAGAARGRRAGAARCRRRTRSCGVEAEGAGVDAEGERRGHLAGTAGGRAHQVAEQRQRQVVDRDVAQVLQRMQRRRRGRRRTGRSPATNGPSRVALAVAAAEECRAVGHGRKRRRSCGRDSRQGKTQLGRRRRLERRQRQHAAGRCRAGVSRAAQAGARCARRRTRSTSRASGAACQQLAARQPDDAEAAHLDQAGERRRRRGDQACRPWPTSSVWSSATRRRAGLDQAQRQVGLARRPTARAAARRASARRCGCMATRGAHARTSSLGHCRGRPPGTRMVKRAPRTRPSAARRLAAVIEPP